MGRKSREKRERRALQQGLQWVDEVGPFDYSLMEKVFKRIRQHRKDNPGLFYGSFDTPADAMESGDAQDGRTIR